MKSGSRKIIKKYGLSVSPCIIPLCMRIGYVLSKYSPTNVGGIVNKYYLPML